MKSPRQAAIAAGKTRYFGKVCAKHPELRGERTVSGHCLLCRRVCNRKYYEENREAKLADQRKRNEERREAIRAYDRVRNEERREAILAAKHKYYEENREARSVYQRDYRARQKELQCSL